MVLADTSVWIAHFRHGEPKLAELLVRGSILIHPWILGELACGNLRDRHSIFADLGALPRVQLSPQADTLALIDERKLWGRGLGWTDVHLLASALLSQCALWTLDKRLSAAAADLGLALT